MAFAVKMEEADCHVCSHDYVLYVHWGHQFANTLEYSRLRVILCEDTEDSRMTMVPYEGLSRIKEINLDFDLGISGATGWREVNGNSRFYSTPDLAQYCLRLLLDCIHDRRLGNKREKSETDVLGLTDDYGSAEWKQYY